VRENIGTCVEEVFDKCPRFKTKICLESVMSVQEVSVRHGYVFIVEVTCYTGTGGLNIWKHRE